MEYKDIKTADELESWYTDKQAILDSHARDYMVPFGFVYHLDCSGYVSFERWNDTLPTAEEQTAFQAIQNGVSTKEIIEHKDEFGWTDRACRDAEEYDLAPCFIVPARKEYMQEQEIMNVRELYPELIGPDGEIIWSDPDFAKQGNKEAAGPDNFPGHEFDDHKNPDPDGVPVIAYFFPNGYGTKTNDNGCSNVIASLYGRDNFTSYLARAANEEKILYIDSEKYEQMEKELPRYGGTRFPPALAALSKDIIIPSSYICKMKAEINPKLSDREREHNSLNRTMHIKVADSRRNRLAQDRDKPRNINLRYDDDSHDSQ